ncbi:MAG: restriction endonuclease subunit S [Desulfobacterales bacterium]|nr:restriction endonuclease subunit S [Desulfobacterales bacterium]
MNHGEHEKKSKGLAPKLRFPEFKDDWKRTELGKLIEIKGRIGYRGYTTEDIVKEVEGAISLSPSNITDTGSLSFDKATYISWKKYEESPEIILKDGYTVLVKTGSSFGKAAFVKNLPDKTTINPQLVVFKLIEINSVFLFLIVSNYSIQKQIRECVVGGAIPTLSQENISKFDILIPRMEEQQKIANCLSSIDELITVEAKKLDALKAYKKGLMQALFPAEGETVPKLRFPEFRDAGEWEEKTIQQIAKPVCDKAKVTDENTILTLSAEHGIIHQGDYFGKKIAGKNVDRYTKITINDFVYNDRTTKSFTYGTIKRLSHYTSGLVSPIYKCFRFNEGENPTFWEWYFESGIHDVQLHSLINEGARTGRFNISIQKFLSTQALSPQPPEQQKIADCFSSVDELITAQSEKIDALKAHKKGLMQQLFPSADEERTTPPFGHPSRGGE